jgi:hypothetical protein
MIKLGIIVGPGQNVLVWDCDIFLGEQRHLKVWSMLCGTAHPISSCARLILYLHVSPSQLTVFGSRWLLGRQPYASACTISEMNMSIVEHEASKSLSRKAYGTQHGVGMERGGDDELSGNSVTRRDGSVFCRRISATRTQAHRRSASSTCDFLKPHQPL